MLPNDKDEKLILVQILKKKGFEVKNWGRGNHPLGPRIIAMTLKKDDYECAVNKIYYLTDTIQDSIFTRNEIIKCRKVSS